LGLPKDSRKGTAFGTLRTSLRLAVGTAGFEASRISSNVSQGRLGANRAEAAILRVCTTGASNAERPAGQGHDRRGKERGHDMGAANCGCGSAFLRGTTAACFCSGHRQFPQCVLENSSIRSARAKLVGRYL